MTTGNVQKQIKTTHSTILLIRLRRRANRRHHHGFHQRRLLRDAASLLSETGAISRLRRRSGGDSSQSVHRLRALVVLCHNDGAVTRHRTGVGVINLFFFRHFRQSVTKFIAMTVINLVTSKAAAERKILFNKPTPDSTDLF